MRCRPESGYFLFIASEKTLRMAPLPPGGLLTLGRSRRSDIRLEDRLVSAHHALLEVGSRFAITDLDSRNGTRVESRAIAPLQSTPIQPGDTINIGRTLLVIEPAVGVAGSDASGR
jgi:pSer/pThr/pTyr-binding forkhead associated (FHA) protein